LKADPPSTTHALDRLVRAALGAAHPELGKADLKLSVRRTLQALRIEVNGELSALDALLRALPHCLAPGGRAAILTFHSGEDRRVKKSFQAGFREGIYSAIAGDVIRSTREELLANRRAQAAKLRWAARALAVVGAALLTLSCGGSSTPTAPMPGGPVQGPSIAIGTVVSLRSGETDEPVGGAVVSLSGQSSGGAFNRTFTSDAAGQFTLDRTVLLSPAPLLDVRAAGFIVRSTLLRADETMLSLWPSTSPTGLDEAFSSTIAYSSSACPAVSTGFSSLRRASNTVDTIQVAFGTSLQDMAAQVAHQQAIARLNAAVGGVPRYEFTTSQTGGVSFVAEIDPTHSTCSAGPEPLRAATELAFVNGNVSGGRLVYCTVAAARSVGLVLHELGHTLGLYHSASTSDLMYCSTGRPVDFSARERLVVRLARQRRSGNRWPDDDRLLTTPVSLRASGTEIVMCGDRAAR
jgi:hypothetical protein